MKSRWLILLSASVVVIVIVFYILGFRITYQPELENNWIAIGTVGTWAGALSPIFLAIINAIFAKNIEKTKSEISSSNKIIYEQNFANKNVPEQKSIEEKILTYITVSIMATTEEIAEFVEMNGNDAFSLLCMMEGKKQIVAINRRKNVDKSKVMWKIFK